jgi:DNA-binding GntR family transcriptional regulator
MSMSSKNRSAADDVYEQLYQAIVSGQLRPTERLIETDLARHYRTGRTAIRTALARLEQEGLVEHESHRGARVRAISEEEAIETLEVRAVLEGLAARYAARNATDADIAALRSIIQEMETLHAKDELLGVSDANVRLHALLLRIANHKTVTRLVERLNAQQVRSQFRYLLTPLRRPYSLAEHQAIVEAVAARDPDAAEAAMRHHLTNIIEALYTVIRSQIQVE